MPNEYDLIDRMLLWPYNLLSPEMWVRLNGDKKVDVVASMLPKSNGLSVLDVGGAEGYIVRKLVQRGCLKNAVVVDRLKRHIHQGEQRVCAEGLSGKIEFIEEQATRLPFDCGSFDAVLLLDVLEHMQKREEVINSIRESFRVARQSVLISVPQGLSGKLIDADHLRIWLRYGNSWIYDQNQFQTMLKSEGYSFEVMGSGRYRISK